MNLNKIFLTLKKNNRLFKKYNVKKIGIFGSYSRGDNNENSDIDFIVIFEKPSFDNFMELSFELEEIFDKKVDLVTEESISPYISPKISKQIIWYETK